MARSLIVQEFWGFGLSAQYSGADVKRGQLATYDGTTITPVADNSVTADSNLYVLDKVTVEDPTNLNPLAGIAELDTISDGDYVILRHIREGYYQLASDFFAAKPAAGDELGFDANGKLATVDGVNITAGVAKCYAVIDTPDGSYEVIVGPKY